MRKLLFSLLIAAFVLNVSAQVKGKIRVGFDAGLALPNAGAGFDAGIDIRYNIMDNVNVGVKFNGGLLLKDIAVDDVANTASITTSVISSSLLTSDYYFNDGTSSFAPFLGGGLGLYKVINIGLTATGDTPPEPVSNTANFLPERVFGGLLRGGFEAGHFRMALEYYLIPRTTLYDVNNSNIGTTGNSFLNLTLGFYLGGGRWRK
jgi:hypothetical protein